MAQNEDISETAKKRRCKVCFEDFEHPNFSTNAAIFPYNLYYNLLTTVKFEHRQTGKLVLRRFRGTVFLRIASGAASQIQPPSKRMICPVR